MSLTCCYWSRGLGFGVHTVAKCSSWRRQASCKKGLGFASLSQLGGVRLSVWKSIRCCCLACWLFGESSLPVSISINSLTVPRDRPESRLYFGKLCGRAPEPQNSLAVVWWSPVALQRCSGMPGGGARHGCTSSHSVIEVF